MIINTWMRTDIPAFYSEWLMNRIREGFVYVRNPYYRLQVSKYSLYPNVVDCLAFLYKNPNPMIKYLDELKEKYMNLTYNTSKACGCGTPEPCKLQYNMFWFVTITPYGKDLNPNVSPFEKVIEDFKTLSNKILVQENYKLHNPNSSFLIGENTSEDKIIEAKQKSWITIDNQISFLD